MDELLQRNPRSVPAGTRVVVVVIVVVDHSNVSNNTSIFPTKPEKSLAKTSGTADVMDSEWVESRAISSSNVQKPGLGKGAWPQDECGSTIPSAW